MFECTRASISPRERRDLEEGKWVIASQDAPLGVKAEIVVDEDIAEKLIAVM